MKSLLARSATLLIAVSPALSCLAQTFIPDAGSYTRPITVQITAPVIAPGAAIYYTTDRTTPTTGSILFTGPISVGAGTTTVQAIAVIDGVPGTVASATYTIGPEPSTTSLKLSASPLVLPGALTMTATVNSTPSGGAVPSGNITFNADGKSMGTAPLKMIPSSQAFSRHSVLTDPMTSPVDLTTFVSSPGAQPALLSAQTTFVNTSTALEVALYKLSPGGDAFNAYTYINTSGSDSGYTTDAIVSGYFLQPASTGMQTIFVHEYNGITGLYSVLPGTTNVTNNTLNLNPPLITGTVTKCDCSQPDNETLSVADFNNDGYSDVAYLIQPYFYSVDVYYPGVAGMAVNPGTTAPPAISNFKFLPVPSPSTITTPNVFCPIAIATGNFSSSAGAELAVLAGTANGNCGATFSAMAIYVYSYDATNQVPVLTTTVALPDTNATIVAAADLNNDGIADLIIGESIGTTPTGGILTALAVGDGTFKPVSALSATPTPPIEFTINDFNGDGNLDAAYLNATGYSVLYGDGTGNFSNRTDSTFAPAIMFAPYGITSGDFNGDGLADLASLPNSAIGAARRQTRPAVTPLITNGANVDIALNSTSSQAVLALDAKALAAASYSLTAGFQGDSNFAASTSPATPETVNQTVPVLTWPGSGASIQYGTPLGPAELNATANVPGTFTYTPAAGKVLPLGNETLTAAFTPTDAFDYATASATLAVSVVVVSVSATVSADETTVTAGQQSTLTLTVQPYPETVTATATLAFTPTSANGPQDPTVLFSNNQTSQSIPINPATTATSNTLQFQSGSTAGAITVTVHLTLADGTDVTPSNLQPVTITVPASAPVISSATLSRSGQSLQVAVIALSSTRDMTQAVFHFTPVSGKSLTTTDLTVDLTSAFQAWYSSLTSDQYGTNFTYTQPFTLNSNATDIQSVSVTLVNSAGTSEPATAQ